MTWTRPPAVTGVPHTATAPGVTLLLAMAFVMAYVLGTCLPVFQFAPLFRWTSFAGGVSITYCVPGGVS